MDFMSFQQILPWEVHKMTKARCFCSNIPYFCEMISKTIFSELLERNRHLSLPLLIDKKNLVTVILIMLCSFSLLAQDQNKRNQATQNNKLTFHYDPSIPFDSIIPKGFTIREKQSFKGSDFYIIQDSAKRFGLINHKGTSIFSPAKSQNFKAVDDKIWLAVKNGIYSLYDDTFNRLTTKNYVKIEKLDTRYLIANLPGTINIDIFTTDGDLVSTGKFSDLFRNEGLGYAVYDTQSKVSCTTDTMLNIDKCLPFVEILAIRNHPALFIARKSELYGLVNEQSQEIIPMNYKKIVHIKDLDLLELEHNYFNFDLADLDGNIIYKSFPGFYNFRKITPGLFHAKAEDDHLIYNKTNKKIIKITHPGYLRMDKDLLESRNLLTFVHNELTEFYDLLTGQKRE